MKKLLIAFLMTASFATSANECFLGEVRTFAGNYAPRNWAFAHGQLLAISSNTALFSIIGTIYGGDGRTTFALPDLRGRVVVGQGQGNGLPNYRIGSKGGSETFTLGANQLPQSNFAVLVNAMEQTGEVWAREGKADDTKSVAVPVLGVGQVQGNAVLNGGRQAVPKRDPFTTLNKIICVQGLFPSRS